MKGWATDLYTLTPVAPVKVDLMPPDFDFSAVRVFADAPLDPFVAECETCPDRARCKADRFARPHCVEADLGRRWKTPDQPEAFAANVLRALAAGPATIYELCDRTGMKYGTARHYIALLLASGEIVTAGTRPRRDGRRGQPAWVYAIAAPDTPRVERPPLEPRVTVARKGHARTRMAHRNNEHVLALLRERGELTSSEVGAALGIHKSTADDRLRDLEAQGAVRRVGMAVRQSEVFHGRHFKATVWALA